MAVFFSFLAAGLTLAAEQPRSSSENFSMPIAQTGTAKAAGKKKEPTAEEVVAHQKAFAVARERDHDKTFVITITSETGTCYYHDFDTKLDDFLIDNPDMIVDRKEFPAPAYRIKKIIQGTGSVFNQCTAIMVVHYHKVKGGEEKK